jgi:uncharacterized membrane protein YoaK (UPF0700 family)
MSTEFVTILERRVDRGIGVRNGLLDALTFSSGAVDAISFLGLGKVFTAFMTGNVAFLGMGIARGNGAPRVVSVLASMAGFASGICLATMIVRNSGQPGAETCNQPPALVWPQSTTLALGISLLAHLSFIVIWLATGGRPSDSVIPVLLAVWALAMGMQSAAVRTLNVGGIMTTAATATFIVLVSDWANRIPLTADEHSRLRGVLISLVIGATAGTLLLFHARIYAPVLPFVVTLGVVATAARAFRYRDEEVRRERVASEGRPDAPAA